jgi:2-dehydro-3-deoxyphosphogluconate aldolase/(4S)-4-hydroxy-2-oxoglutarate aldolase
MDHIQSKIATLRLVPVVVIDDAQHASALAESLISGGLPCAEITFRTPAAVESIRRMAAFREICLGAGTVLSVDQVKQAIDAGAGFIVSPGLNPTVVEYCTAHHIPVFPGVCTPTEIETGLGLGLDVFKFFPAEAFGGLATLKSICAPYGKIRFIPTGGIHEGNLAPYLSYDRVLACGGSWMVPRDAIREGRFGDITKLVAKAASVVKQIG